MEKFFDTVNQSKMVEILSRSIKDGRVISLIHKYFRAGAVWMGRFEGKEVGVPQGGPLSLICANIMLNELDHAVLVGCNEIERPKTTWSKEASCIP